MNPVAVHSLPPWHPGTAEFASLVGSCWQWSCLLMADVQVVVLQVKKEFQVFTLKLKSSPKLET